MHRCKYGSVILKSNFYNNFLWFLSMISFKFVIKLIICFEEITVGSEHKNVILNTNKT